MKKDTIRISAALFALVITTAVGVSYTLAHDDNGSFSNSEKHGAVKEAIENNDYTAFAEAVGEDAKILETINENNFNAFVEAKALLHDGNKEGAEEIFEELGVEKRFGKHKRGHHGDSEKHEAVKAAVEAEDYNAFIAAVGEEAPFLETITEENFPVFVEIHELKEAGDFEGAKALAEELGLNYKKGHRDHHKRF